MAAGASITGLVLHKARPVAGVVVVLDGSDLPRARLAETHEATTDASGRFRFDDVLPGGEFRLYTRMASPAALGQASIPRDVTAPGIRETLEVGELNLHPGHRVRGRVLLADGRRPEGVLAVLERSTADDAQQQPVDDDGAFAFEGVPSESVVLWFRAAKANYVFGYRLSHQNASLDWLVRAALCGRVDDDLEIAVLLEPGFGSAYVAREFRRQRSLNERIADQRRIECAPLHGIAPEQVSRIGTHAR